MAEEFRNVQEIAPILLHLAVGHLASSKTLDQLKKSMNVTHRNAVSAQIHRTVFAFKAWLQLFRKTEEDSLIELLFSFDITAVPGNYTSGLSGENAVCLVVEEFRNVREPAPIPLHPEVDQHV